jgi:hypothetical protein
MFPIFGHQNRGSGSILTKNSGSKSALKPLKIHNTGANKGQTVARLALYFPKDGDSLWVSTL